MLLLSLRESSKISSPVRIHSFATFGFDVDGEYSLKFHDVSHHNIFFGLTLPPEYKTISARSEDLIPKVCTGEHPQIWKDIQNNTEISGKITQAGVYNAFLVNCDEQHSAFSVTNERLFFNPDSRTDNRWKGYSTVKIVAIISYFTMLVIWFINWFTHFQIQIVFHYILTASFCIAFFYQLVRFYELYSMTISDTFIVAKVFSNIFAFLSYASFFITLLLAAKGWCIIRDSISVSDFVKSFIYSFMYIGFTIIANSVPMVEWLQMVMILLSLIFVFLFVRELINSINEASVSIWAHMLVISNEGIDPKTTPVYQKHLMYNQYQWAVVIGCILFVCKVVADLIGISFILSEFLTDAIKLIIIIMLSWIFRLRGRQATGYSTFEDESNDIKLSDIEGANIKVGEIKEGGRQWEEGMELPPAPHVITIDSPDGQGTISAVVTETINDQIHVEEEDEMIEPMNQPGEKIPDLIPQSA